MKELRKPSLDEVYFVLKGIIPPSVNHYVKHTRTGRHYKTKEASNFAIAVSALSKGSVDSDWLELSVHIYLGKGQKGDGDNFFKVIADSLVQAGIIRSDAAIVDWHLYKRRDKDNPRTEIILRNLNDK